MLIVLQLLDVTITPSGIFTITEDVSVDNMNIYGFISANGVFTQVSLLSQFQEMF